MKPLFAPIYLASREYWNTRFNDIHIPLSYDFVRQLLLAYPDANEDVVVPAILLHDNGWKMIPEDLQNQSFGPNMKREDLRRLHETEGVRIADEILTKLGFISTLNGEILEIIDGHDSRPGALSLNDKLVKDADKLWRFTPTGQDIDHRRFERELMAHALWTREQIDEWFFTDRAKQIAQDVLKQTIAE
ncbi:MAG: HD domain-containing protein [Chloroflexota bacterium]